NFFQKISLKNMLKYRLCCCHCKWISAKCCTMRSRSKSLCQLFLGQHCTHWKTITKPFCQRDNIWGYIVLLKGKFGSRSADARLYFINNKQKIILLAQLFYSCYK